VIPKSMLEWRQDNDCLTAGRRLLDNKDFQRLLRTLEGFALMQRDLPPQSPDVDLHRKYGEGCGHRHFIGFIYTMGTRFEPQRSENIEAKFGAKEE